MKNKTTQQTERNSTELSPVQPAKSIPKAIMKQASDGLRLSRPQILKPVQPPSKRDGSQLSGSDMNFMDGYVSTGTAGGANFTSGYMS